MTERTVRNRSKHTNTSNTLDVPNRLFAHSPQPYRHNYTQFTQPNALIVSPHTVRTSISQSSQYEIILQNQATQHAVLFQPSTKNVVLWHGANTTNHIVQRTNTAVQRNSISTVDTDSDTDSYNRVCSTCGQTIPNTTQQQKHSTTDYNTQYYNDVYMSTDYFKLLQYTVDDSDNEPSQYNINDTDTLPTSVFNTGYYNKFFTERKLIGRGGYGACYLTDHILDNEILGRYACKKIPVGDSRQWLLRVLKEVRALERVHHANVVAYKHSWLEMYRAADFGPEIPCLFMLMEYADQGTLSDIIWPKRQTRTSIPIQLNTLGYLNEYDIWYLLRDIAKGLRFLHRTGIIHRDLKCENILLRSDINSNDNITGVRCLVADFGNAIIQGSTYQQTGYTGTMVYTAPELLQQSNTNTTIPSTQSGSIHISTEDVNPHINGNRNLQYNESVDLYSLGVILYAMTYNALPYDDSIQWTTQSLYQQQSQQKTIQFPAVPRRSNELLATIQSLMSFNPDDRMPLDQVLQIVNNQLNSIKSSQINDTDIQATTLMRRTSQNTQSSPLLMPASQSSDNISALVPTDTIDSTELSPPSPPLALQGRVLPLRLPAVNTESKQLLAINSNVKHKTYNKYTNRIRQNVLYYYTTHMYDINFVAILILTAVRIAVCMQHQITDIKLLSPILLISSIWYWLLISDTHYTVSQHIPNVLITITAIYTFVIQYNTCTSLSCTIVAVLMQLMWMCVEQLLQIINVKYKYNNRLM